MEVFMTLIISLYDVEKY